MKDLVGGVATAAAALTAIVSILIALVSYRDQARSRRTQWLLDLRQRLVETESIRMARSEIEHAALTREGLAIEAMTKFNQRRPGQTVSMSKEESQLVLAIRDHLNTFEVLERLIEASRLDPRDVYFAFVADLESALKLEEIDAEVKRNYPSTLRLRDRFTTIHNQEYGPHS